MIEVGILKNFDSGTYKAGVQLAGSLTTYFDGISVAKNIPSSALVIGNYVIVAIPGGNPKDACVIATWPGGTPGGGMEVHGNEYHDPNFASEAALAAHAALTKGVHSLNKSCRVTRDAPQTIANVTFTPLAFNVEAWDTDDIHDNVPNNSRLTCKTAGNYLIIASLAWAAGGNSGYRLLCITRNGTGNRISQDFKITNLECGVTTFALYPLAVNDYVEAEVYQYSGGNLDVQYVAGISPIFMMVRLP